MSSPSSWWTFSRSLAVLDLALGHHLVEVVRRRDLRRTEAWSRELLHRLGLGLFVLARLALFADTLIERELRVFCIPLHGAENRLAPTDTAVDNRAFHVASSGDQGEVSEDELMTARHTLEQDFEAQALEILHDVRALSRLATSALHVISLRVVSELLRGADIVVLRHFYHLVPIQGRAPLRNPLFNDLLPTGDNLSPTEVEYYCLGENA